ncbi:MAG: LapA family protein [Paracoccus sp. (in: a-proteobacteria)]|uniref:LapA family protein n=1 Tax=Paracoccus sp. TaxID=267 RepID=UPI0026DEC0D5|nr:LapA family protein [Paracoccus sp. (in: a-proteobacteria)]MDO5622966.1 LapA family protein [Paracoccus sp. (in: a-proteobacteria)]
MRLIRLIFVVLLALVLIAVALANRQVVTLNAFPAQFGQYLGGTWSVQLPLFLVILLAVLIGMVAGLVWEWLREAHLRREVSYREAELARLKQSPGHHAPNLRPQDEILAIVDAPKRMPSSPRPIPSAEPAPGTTLPSAPRG